MYLFDFITAHTSLTPTDLRFGIKIITETLIVFLYIIAFSFAFSISFFL